MITWKDYEKEVKKRGGQPAQDLQMVDEIVKLITIIAHRREELGISQHKLASLVKIPQSSVARIESCVVFPKLDTLVKILQPLGLKITLTSI